jgi:hypothetical protein
MLPCPPRPTITIPNTRGSTEINVEVNVLISVGDTKDTGRKLPSFVAGVLVLALVPALLLRAQEPANPVPPVAPASALAQFEIASVKRSAAESHLKVDFAPGGKLVITNATLHFLIKIAYDIGDDQLAGGAG